MRKCSRSGGWRELPLFLACAATVSAAVAEPIAAGYRDLVNVSVDEGQAVTQDDWVWRAAEAVIYKVGAGSLTFTPSAVLDSSAFGIGIRDGNVTFAGGSASEMEAPVSVLNTARLWMDATRNYVLSNGTTYVSEWHDVRETKTEAPFDYPRAVSRWNTSTAANAVENALPEVSTLDNGKQAFWFGGYRSGRYMAFLSPTESNPAASPLSITGINEAFVVYSFTNRFTYLFGNTTEGSDFHPATSQMNATDSYARKDYAGTLSPAWWLDGVPFDASETAAKSGCHLIDYEFPDVKASAGTIFNGGTSYTGATARQGGDHLCEFLLFTNKLSSADRVKVQTYLLNKWKSFSRDSAVDVAVAAGASVTMDSANGVFPVPLEISGDGSIKKTGSGNGAIGYARDVAPFAGRLSVEDGSVTLRDDIAFAAGSGMRIVASNALDGVNVSVAAAPAGNLVKDGAGTIRLDAVPDGVSAISVSGGTLILAPPVSNTLLAAGSDVGASITNSSFELESSKVISGLRGVEKGGWSFSYSPDWAFQDSYAILLNCVDMTTDAWNLGHEVPVGKSVLGLRADMQASTWIDVPLDGVYELSCWVRAKDANANPMYLKVLIGEDAENLREIAAMTYMSKTWRHFTWRIPALTAGRKLFMFRQMAYTGQERSAHLIDDLKLSYRGRDDGTIPVPNGGFEACDRMSYANLTSFSAATAEGWTFTQPAWTNKTAVGIVREGVIVSGKLTGPNPGQMRDGLVQLLMCSSGGTARVSFAAPKAGTYRLRADAGAWCKAYLHDGSSYPAAAVAASVKVGDGAETSLGSVSRNGLMMKESVWPTAFTIPNAGDTVTLTMTSTQRRNGMLLDNFVLVPVQPDEELVSNGSFTSSGGTWVYEAVGRTGSDADPAGRISAGRFNQSGNEYNYGSDRYDDNYFLSLIDTGRASQTVDIPAPGRYCLRFYSRMRIHGSFPNEPYRYGKNTLHVYLAKDGVTNSLAKILCDTTNFVGQCIRFDVPAAASDWSLGFEGMNVPTASYRDKCIFVDGVSLKRCTDEPSSAMPIPKTLAVSVAADAKLRLDFSGTNEVSVLSLGGQRVTGFISSATHPDYITGSGVLEIKPRGTVVLFR